jgi:hypothetical protein
MNKHNQEQVNGYVLGLISPPSMLSSLVLLLLFNDTCTPLILCALPTMSHGPCMLEMSHTLSVCAGAVVGADEQGPGGRVPCRAADPGR